MGVPASDQQRVPGQRGVPDQQGFLPLINRGFLINWGGSDQQGFLPLINRGFLTNPEQQGFLAADQQWVPDQQGVPVSDQQRVPDLQGCLPADQQGGPGQWRVP